jgi:hypothetical protein
MLEASNSIVEAISLHLSIRHRVEQWAGKGISSKEGTYIAHEFIWPPYTGCKRRSYPSCSPSSSSGIYVLPFNSKHHERRGSRCSAALTLSTTFSDIKVYFPSKRRSDLLPPLPFHSDAAILLPLFGVDSFSRRNLQKEGSDRKHHRLDGLWASA